MGSSFWKRMAIRAAIADGIRGEAANAHHTRFSQADPVSPVTLRQLMLHFLMTVVTPQYEFWAGNGLFKNFCRLTYTVGHPLSHDILLWISGMFCQPDGWYCSYWTGNCDSKLNNPFWPIDIHYGAFTLPWHFGVNFWQVPPAGWLILQLLDRKCDCRLN